ncbi:MAG: hypothetical protein AB4041_12650 [Microcystaceae cyanobacterium]
MMVSQILILIAAFAVAWLVFSGLLKIIKTSVGTAFKVAIIVLVLQLVFGISPYDLWQEIINLPQRIQELLS